MNAEITTDSAGQIIGISHHDGELQGILFSRDNRIMHSIAGVSGQVTNIFLDEVKFSVANNLREGNVIDRMYLWDWRSAPPNVVVRMLKALDIIAPEKLSEEIREIFKIFLLECSYGVEFFAIVRRVEAKVDGGFVGRISEA